MNRLGALICGKVTQRIQIPGILKAVCTVCRHSQHFSCVRIHHDNTDIFGTLILTVLHRIIEFCNFVFCDRLQVCING